MNVKEKRGITQALEQESNDLLVAVLEKVESELHIVHFGCRAEFWEKFKVTNLFAKICIILRDIYINTYSEFQKGKSKFLQFQLEWYKRCSLLLQESIGSTTISPQQSCISEWIVFRSDCIKQLKDNNFFHSNSVMIAVQSAVYNYLNSKVIQATPTVEVESGTVIPNGRVSSGQECESEDVYFRFGGAALAEMLRIRYRTIHTSPIEKRSGIASEITVLKAMQCTDKSVVPASLQYRDNGFMYFPHPDFIPFTKAVDEQVRHLANTNGMQMHGKNLIQVTTESVFNKLELKEVYTKALLTRFDTIDGIKTAADNVYSEMLRKLCNTRLAEFFDCFKQMQASKAGSASLAGLNLRDALLHDHVNLKTVFSN